MTKVYELESVTDSGGPMGTLSTSTNFRRYFTTAAKAQAAALKDYRKESGDRTAVLKWHKSGLTGRTMSTAGLRFVMYHIRLLHIERGKE